MFSGKEFPKIPGFAELLDFVYPPFCLVCDGEISISDQIVCGDCWNKASGNEFIFCINCRNILIENLECPDCRDNSHFPVLCLGHYIPPLKDIIHHFKYHGYSKLGRNLADNLPSGYVELLKKARIDHIIPIPLDSYREKGRGFNQAAVLSDIISEKVNLPVLDDVLRKIRRTKDQTRLDIMQREENMKGAFRANSELIAGKRILLVDDVITTGATLREAAGAVCAAGGDVAAALAVASA